MSDIDHTRDCILPSDGKAEGLVRASELFALAAERDALRAENERLRSALREIEALEGGINPSNYSHDDVLALNNSFCEAFDIAHAALDTQPAPKEDRT